METLLTGLYLMTLFCGLLLISEGILKAYDAHKRGMARVRAYDNKQKGGN